MNPDTTKQMDWDNLVLFHFFDVCREQWPSSKTNIHPESYLAKYLTNLANVRNTWITRRIQVQNKIADKCSTVVCLACISLNRSLVVTSEPRGDADIKDARREDKDTKWVKRKWAFSPNSSMVPSLIITDPAPEISTETVRLCAKLTEFLQLASRAHVKNQTTADAPLDMSLGKAIDNPSLSRVIQVKIEVGGEAKEEWINDPWLQTHETANATEDFHVECALLVSTFDSLVRFHVQHTIKSSSNIGDLWHNFFEPDASRLDELTSSIMQNQDLATLRHAVSVAFETW